MSNKVYTWQEVGKHNKQDDLWVVVGDNVYNVTKYQNQHPGGPVVFTNRAGKNASLAFQQASHSTNAIQNVMPEYRIGTIDKDSIMETWQKQAQSSGQNLLVSILFAIVLIAAIYYIAS